MPITWTDIGSFDLPHKTWTRLPVVEFSEVFRLNFSTPDWDLWNARYGGWIIIRSVFLPDGEGEEIGEDKRVFIDDTPSPRILTLPFPPNYLVSGISQRHLEAYRYSRRRRPLADLPLTMTIAKS